MKAMLEEMMCFVVKQGRGKVQQSEVKGKGK